MQLYANRSQTEANQDFGARTEGTFETSVQPEAQGRQLSAKLGGRG